jgi:hypothetical protein
MKLKFLLIPVLAVYICSCGRKEEKAGTTKTDSTSVRLEAAADSSWTSMIRSDDGKIANIERLISEMLLIEGSDSIGLLELRKKAADLPSRRYDRTTMGEPGRIDQYDSLCTELITLLRKQISRTPTAENYQIVNQLNKEIGQAEDSVLFYRMGYDSFIDQINSIRGKKSRKNADNKPAEQSLLPVFRKIS